MGEGVHQKDTQIEYCGQKNGKLIINALWVEQTTVAFWRGLHAKHSIFIGAIDYFA